ncbi:MULTISPECIES: hypothetical protein [Nostoc]|uniref:CsbD-like domain-containing protein n=1 Tax=Nostoc paludosum FACHB-159 TaxID=2692908 RepID=A0ABR8KGR3_9NOSO|nr:MULTISPECIES: hypothetical protein [Nostoc]MBD2679395.1 hypothetical protein [Nostoc sp. FACHB-857]MBD2737247.1 hypothetical protein [Nostoc paludosum FACHB-159]
MKNLISNAIGHISSLLQGLQVKRFLAVALVGFLVLTTNITSGSSNQDLGQRVRQQVEQNDAQRPKTTGQWNREARETEGSPGERLQRIGQQSGEAFKEFGSGYVQGAKETARDVGNSPAKTGQNLSNQVQR